MVSYKKSMKTAVINKYQNKFKRELPFIKSAGSNFGKVR